MTNGSICFQPRLLQREEFFEEKRAFTYLGIDGRESVWTLPAESLGFTYCQVPVCYRLAETASISLERAQGVTRIEGNRLPAAESAEIFSREGSIAKIVVEIPKKNLRS